MKLKKIILPVLLLLLLIPMPVAAAPSGIPFMDQVVFNSTFVIEAGEIFYGDIVSFNGTIIIEEGAVLHGDLIAFGGEIILQGKIYGNIIRFGASDLNLDHSNVLGEIIAFGNSSYSFEEQMDETSLNLIVQRNWIFSFFGHIWVGFGEFLGIILTAFGFSSIAILIFAIAKDRLENTHLSMKKEPVISFVMGLIVFIVVPIVVLLLAVTILLFPVALFLLLVFFLTIIFSISVMGQLVGTFLMDLFKTNWSEIVRVGVGTFVFVIGLVFLMKLPCIGWSLFILMTSFGVGSFLVSNFGSQIFNKEA